MKEIIVNDCPELLYDSGDEIGAADVRHLMSGYWQKMLASDANGVRHQVLPHDGAKGRATTPSRRTPSCRAAPHRIALPGVLRGTNAGRRGGDDRRVLKTSNAALPRRGDQRVTANSHSCNAKAFAGLEDTEWLTESFAFGREKVWRCRVEFEHFIMAGHRRAAREYQMQVAPLPPR